MKKTTEEIVYHLMLAGLQLLQKRTNTTKEARHLKGSLGKIVEDYESLLSQKRAEESKKWSLP